MAAARTLSLRRNDMKSVKPILLFIAVLFLATNFSFSAKGQTTSSNGLSPNALVADLYRGHNATHSPFFQTRSRPLLYKYFEKSLADMIRKDAVSSNDAAGA